MTGHRRWEDIHHKSSPEALAVARAELERSLTEPFTYRLVVLTHGAGGTLERCLASFAANVIPAPAETLLVVDGPARGFHQQAFMQLDLKRPYEFSHRGVCYSDEQQGFCAATARAWAEGSRAQLSWNPNAPSVTHVFHLEHDFEVTEPVDLRDLAEVLDGNPNLAQMSLMRQAVNAQEISAGGLYESRRDEYTDHSLSDQVDYMTHRSYFSTNPSLMRREFMEQHPWPDPHTVTAECEGIYGWALREQGWEFAVWGDGTPNCEHIGVRDGIGY